MSVSRTSPFTAGIEVLIRLPYFRFRHYDSSTVWEQTSREVATEEPCVLQHPGDVIRDVYSCLWQHHQHSLYRTVGIAYRYSTSRAQAIL